MTTAWDAATVGGIFPDPDWPLDPYLVWADMSEFAGFHMTAGSAVPVLFELGTPVTGSVPTTAAVTALVNRCVRANPLNRIRPARFGTANVGRSELPVLCEAVRAGLLARFQLGLARGERDIPVPRELTADFVVTVPLTDRLQTIGVIDDGCCLAHDAFRSPGKSRFVAVWDQDKQATDDPIYWDKSIDVPYGVELRIGAVEALFTQQPAIGEAAERAVYETILRPEWGMESRRHGAGVLHVLSAANERMIFVQLPGETVADSSGGSLGVYLLDGVRYIVEQTQILARRERREHWTTTINVSLGSIAGPHDGTTIIEAALAEIASDGKVRIVLAAGNTSGKRVHGMRSIRRRDPGRFDVMVPPDNPRESFVEVWLPAHDIEGTLLDPADFTIVVVPPDGSPSPKIGVDQALRLVAGSGAQAGVVFCRRVSQGKHGTMMLLALRSTRVRGETRFAHAPYGVWSINVSSKSQRAADVHAWVERNDLIVGRRRPQQAFFVDDPESPYVDDRLTLSSIANGANVIVVGAYQMHDETVADYSAQGPTRGTARRGPDFLGPSDESAALKGVQVPGFYSGSMSRMSGTSVAAPHVARWLVTGSPADKQFELESSGSSTANTAAAAMRAGPETRRGPRNPETVPAIRP